MDFGNGSGYTGSMWRDEEEGERWRRGRGGGGGEVDFGNGSGYRGWMLRERRLRDYRKEIMV